MTPIDFFMLLWAIFSLSVLMGISTAYLFLVVQTTHQLASNALRRFNDPQ